MNDREAADHDFVEGSGSPQSTAGHGELGHRQGTKRKKYAARACHECKRRKVKCSGDESCQQCRGRLVRCRYSPIPATTRSSTERNEQRRRTPPPMSRAAKEAESANARVLPAATHPCDGLVDRVRALERLVPHLLESCKSPDVQGTFSTPLRPNASSEDEEANQFAATETTPDDLTLSSQVAAMSAFLSRPPSPKRKSRYQGSGAGIVVEFPDPPSLQRLLNVYFRDMDTYFPFLDRQDTESRIYSLVGRLGYSAYNRILVVGVEDLSDIALTCIMLALAEAVDPGEGAYDGTSRPGWDKYLQSCRAIHLFCRHQAPNISIVGAQGLVSAYLMHHELLSAASHAISVAWQLAISIRLNNRNAGPGKERSSNQAREKLWWTIYYLDRQISRRSGTPYHIRDTEFDVDDFASSSAEPEHDVEVATTQDYLQSLINLARVWGHVWDSFFAVGVAKKGDWMEVEIMDARIMNSRRQIPTTLTWDSNELANYTINGESEPHICRRLQLFTRYHLLRMLIRQNPARPTAFTPETAYLCAGMSREIIQAHDLYIARFPKTRAIGYFTTSTLVECTYHLAQVMHHCSRDNHEHAACIAAFNKAHCLLVKLATYSNVAKRAVDALTGLRRKWGTADEPGSTNESQHTIGHPTASGALNASFSLGVAASHPTPLDRSNAHQRVTTNNLDLGMAVDDTQECAMPRADDFGLDLGDWMNVPMGSLYSIDFEPRPDTMFYDIQPDPHS